MTIEEKLKALILRRYHSVREFTISIGLPYSTMSSIFERGIGNSSISNIMKICKALQISVDGLADGEIVPVGKPATRKINDLIEVKDVLNDTKDLLTHSGFITLDGYPIDKTEIDAIFDAMDVGIEIAKRKRR